MKKAVTPPPPQSLEDWRWTARIKQKDAAAKLGVSIGYYSRLERRELYPHRNLAKIISAETGIPIMNLLGLAS